MPDTLPAQLNNSDPGNVSLGFIYLSNNSISGSLPAVWGDAVNGWGQFLQGLYLDTNQLTGQLPQLWSDSNSMSNLFRADLFLNQMTGSVAWNPVNFPSLGNLVLLPGEQCMCTCSLQDSYCVFACASLQDSYCVFACACYAQSHEYYPLLVLSTMQLTCVYSK